MTTEMDRIIEALEAAQAYYVANSGGHPSDYADLKAMTGVAITDAYRLNGMDLKSGSFFIHELDQIATKAEALAGDAVTKATRKAANGDRADFWLGRKAGLEDAAAVIRAAVTESG